MTFLYQDAADALLAHILNYIHNFPSKLGTDVVSSQVDESDDRDPSLHGNVVYSTLNENTLFSVAEASNPVNTSTVAQVIIRDAVGKHTWNFGIKSQIENSHLGLVEYGLTLILGRSD